MNFEDMNKAWNQVLDEFFSQANLKPRQIVVLGCSTSEVMGQHIGKASSEEVADALLPLLLAKVRARELYLAVQGCEHLNRALVVEEACVEHYGLDAVTVVPSLSAGGSMAVKAWQTYKEPMMVETIRGHAGIDVGDTFIGMHLRPVVVPIRPSIKEIGHAHLTMARTRPRLIGGPRAMYPVV
ncbi:TIGR01440 family protein [Desulfitobacterium sp. PCE1]|uniref:TIGR01440 family protein n=1 Tax=Desulfitobacterium sp. PCE1 TaxID=146907 RepID=UPI000367E710|nr:TIGR01440 family protein [Desulfitobacterium sp. PCE1]